MSTGYTHFDKLAFNQLFAIGPDGSESLLINSSGTFVGVISSTGTESVTRILVGNGTASVPSISFNLEQTMGFYRSGSKSFLASINSANLCQFSTAGLSVTGIVAASDGAVGAPSLTFSADLDSGIYRTGANAYDLVTGGASAVSIDSSQKATFKGIVSVPNGTAALPSVSNGAGTTGVYFTAAPLYGITVAGNSQFEMDATSIFYRGSTLEMRKSLSGNEVNFTSRNQSNTASSNALFNAIVAGTSAGDPYYNAIITSGASWAWGARNSDADAFYISPSSDLSTAPFFKITTGGAITIGAGTSTQHILQTLLATNGAQVATMTNLPAAATAGNPVGWIQKTINGTTRYMPFW